MNIHKLSLPVILCISLTGLQAQLSQAEIDSIVNYQVRQLTDKSNLFGLSLGIYYAGQEYFYNYGSTEVGGQPPATENTVYEIGSITKTFTGILLAQAVAEDRIKLSDDIRDHLNGNYTNLVYGDIPVQVVYLANHSSGLPEDLIPQEFYSFADPTLWDIINFYEGDDGTLFRRDLQQASLESEPGTKIQYSNAGMIVLGMILENVYGENYSDLIRERFAQKLGMINTATVSFVNDTSAYTKGYDKKGNIMPHITFQIAGAAGGLISTAKDMVAYMAANLAGVDPAFGLAHGSTAAIAGQTIGLGWQIGQDDRGMKMLWHDGGEPGFSSYISIIPERKLGIVCLTNQRGRQNQLTDLSQRILSEL
ncbi:MAG: serine hydrolase domain-containing protein [Candidatus Neomarinimicrobiota bacterium]